MGQAAEPVTLDLPVHYRIAWDSDGESMKSIPLSGDFRLEKSFDEEILRLRLIGTFDTPNSYLFQDLVFFEIDFWEKNGHPLRQVQLDLCGVTRLDSAAVSALILLRQRLGGKALSLQNMPMDLAHSFERVGLGWLFEPGP